MDSGWLVSGAHLKTTFRLVLFYASRESVALAVLHHQLWTNIYPCSHWKSNHYGLSIACNHLQWWSIETSPFGWSYFCAATLHGHKTSLGQYNLWTDFVRQVSLTLLSFLFDIEIFLIRSSHSTLHSVQYLVTYHWTTPRSCWPFLMWPLLKPPRN